jgi:two-component system KDP operon response regulator KdpE
MRRVRILVVDDEVAILKLLRANLEANGFETVAAVDGREALQTIERELPDLVVLDIMIPKVDGFEVCRRLREWSEIPVIMLSARGGEEDKVKCLGLGADDYVTKPFGPEELVARVRAVLRRSEGSREIPLKASFTSGDLKIDFVERRVTVGGDEVRLTPTEYNLLQELVLNAGKVLTYTHLLSKVWGPEYRQEREYLHVFIGRLRAKLGADATKRGHILTLPSVGYRFEASA